MNAHNCWDASASMVGEGGDNPFLHGRPPHTPIHATPHLHPQMRLLSHAQRDENELDISNLTKFLLKTYLYVHNIHMFQSLNLCGWS